MTSLPQTSDSARDRLAVVSVLEACEAGDYGHGVEILLGALEDVDRPPGVRCEICGARFQWPGLLDHHQRFAHVGAEPA